MNEAKTVRASQRARSPTPDTLILLPSMSYSEGVLAAVPYARHLGERSLSELVALRDPRVSAVLVSAEEIDPWVIDHVLASLSAGDERLRCDMHRRLRCLGQSTTGHASLADAVLADPHAMAACARR